MRFDVPAHMRLTDGHAWINTNANNTWSKPKIGPQVLAKPEPGMSVKELMDLCGLAPRSAIKIHGMLNADREYIWSVFLRLQSIEKTKKEIGMSMDQTRELLWSIADDKGVVTTDITRPGSIYKKLTKDTEYGKVD